MKYFKEAILRIAKENKNGFTISLEDFKAPKRGYIVAYKETQNCFGEKGLEKVLNHALKTKKIIGGWLDEETKLYYFDSCMIINDRNKALELAKENKQLAIFDIENQLVIRVK